MKNQKLIVLLKTLGEEQMEMYSQLLSIPIFNQNNSINLLFSYLRGFHPDYDDETLNERNAFAYIYGDRKYVKSRRTITKLSSNLYRILSLLIYVERTMGDESKRQLSLLMHFRDTKQMDEFNKLAASIKRKLTKAPKNPQASYQFFMVERETNWFQSFLLDTGRGDVNFQATSEALDKYYIFQKLVYTCQILNRNSIVAGPPIPLGLQEVLDNIPATDYLKEPEILLWYKAYQMFREPPSEREPYLKELKALLLGGGDLICDEEHSRILCVYIENNIILVYKDERRVEELFGLYEYQRETGLLFLNDTIAPQAIRNYVNGAVELGRLDKAESLLKENQGRILPQMKETHDLCQAIILASKGEWDGVDGILLCLASKNLYEKINVKRLLIKSAYHQGLWDVLDSRINSYRVFLTTNRDNITERHLESHRNFLNLLHKIIYSSEAELSGMEAIIKETHPLIEKKWLLGIL